MTYNDLFKKLSTMTDEQKMQTVTVQSFIDDEYYPVDSTNISDINNGVLDPGHFYLIFN